MKLLETAPTPICLFARTMGSRHRGTTNYWGGADSAAGQAVRAAVVGAAYDGLTNPSDNGRVESGFLRLTEDAPDVWTEDLEDAKKDKDRSEGKAESAEKSKAGDDFAFVAGQSGAVYQNGLPVFPGQKVYPGDRLRTGRGGQLMLYFPKDSAVVALAPNTHGMAMPSKTHLVHVAGGGALIEVDEKRKNKRQVGVMAGSDNFTALGTEYIVGANKLLGESEVLTLKGTVEYNTSTSQGNKVPRGQWGGRGGRYTEGPIKSIPGIPDGILNGMRGSFTTKQQFATSAWR